MDWDLMDWVEFLTDVKEEAGPIAKAAFRDAKNVAKDATRDFGFIARAVAKAVRNKVDPFSGLSEEERSTLTLFMRYGDFDFKDGHFIVHVNQDKLNNIINVVDSIDFFDLSSNVEWNQILRAAKFPEPVEYVFDNITFSKAFALWAHGNQKLVFSNCKDFLFISVHPGVEVEFNHCKFLGAVGCDCETPANITIKDSNMMVEKMIADCLDIHNSQLSNSKDYDTIDLQATTFKAEKTIIDCKNLHINAKSIANTDNLCIISSEGVTIDNEDNNYIDCIVEAPFVVYNGKEYTRHSDDSIGFGTPQTFFRRK